MRGVRFQRGQADRCKNGNNYISHGKVLTTLRDPTVVAQLERYEIVRIRTYACLNLYNTRGAQWSVL